MLRISQMYYMCIYFFFLDPTYSMLNFSFDLQYPVNAITSLRVCHQFSLLL